MLSDAVFQAKLWCYEQMELINMCLVEYDPLHYLGTTCLVRSVPV